MLGLSKEILDHPAIWRGSQYAKVAFASIPTGHSALDEQLPGGGWPRAALTEILAERQGIGEFSLLMPALAQLSKSREWIALVNPPYIPYAPALANAGVELARVIVLHPGNDQESLWAAERCLHSKACSAVMFWAPTHIEHTSCRRLQWAAEAGQTWGVMCREAYWARHTSPAALRLLLEKTPDQLKIHLLKRRGGSGVREIFLDEAPVPFITPSQTRAVPTWQPPRLRHRAA